MKALLITALISFLCSIVFRLMHWPGVALLILLALMCVLTFSLINSFVKKSVWKISIFGGWVLAAWTIYIVFRSFYWYCGPRIFGINSMFLFNSILTIIYLITQSKQLSKTVLTLSVLGLLLHFTPSYKICYFFDLNEVINKEFNKVNFSSWDKYSWFLYIRGEKEEALKANQKAIDAYTYNDTGVSNYRLRVDDEILTQLENHKRGIINDTWEDSYIRMF
ncbi:hypothetical protein SAMN05216474_0637 [Lishizhenia tianjinensis]|uniref:Uncharacterized protein n=1 Tax=Lishizhenia tianjinensis TaxID=477690 RepID=A0A1I6Y3K8_9FLAO|nr:hypothetical protein [Lishizhenia tianjinensis]SFT45078.1 hypothetical protein SAMN05216474_0637 [Lishizhenia tianjinensis]